MEQNFQTSFIPKKPMIEDRVNTTRPVSLLTIISIFIFFTMLLVTGGLYFYKSVVAGNIKKMEASLNLAKNRFEPAKIVQLQNLDKRLRAANEILDKHVAISPIFKALGDITMKTIRYTQFTYSLTEGKDPRVEVKITGQAVGYRSVALQSDLFSQNQFFIDPVFSNLNLDDKGNVLFELDFTVDPIFVDYQEVLKTAETAPSFSQDQIMPEYIPAEEVGNEINMGYPQ